VTSPSEVVIFQALEYWVRRYADVNRSRHASETGPSYWEDQLSPDTRPDAPTTRVHTPQRDSTDGQQVDSRSGPLLGLRQREPRDGGKAEVGALS